MRRTIPGNLRRVVGLVAGPDRQSQSIAGSMAIATNTFSPMSTGATRQSFTGDPGYGVNQFTGLTAPHQTFYGLVRPIARPAGPNVGMQAGPSDQPGYPATGGDNGALGWMSLAAGNRVGFGG